MRRSTVLLLTIAVATAGSLVRAGTPASAEDVRTVQPTEQPAPTTVAPVPTTAIPPNTAPTNPCAVAQPAKPVAAAAGLSVVSGSEQPDDTCDGHLTSKKNGSSTPTIYRNTKKTTTSVTVSITNFGRCPVVYQTTGANAVGPFTVPAARRGVPGNEAVEIDIDPGERLEFECEENKSGSCDFAFTVTKTA